MSTRGSRRARPSWQSFDVMSNIGSSRSTTTSARSHVVVEDVRGLVQTVGEGLVAVGETQKQNTEMLRGEIGEVRDLLTASYRYLDRRLTAPEGHA